MLVEQDNPLSAIGFLTVVEHTSHGLFGGYLVVDRSAKPLEFHCTAPVRANRAQEILYGPTLNEYLYGEQIGLALLRKSRLKAGVILTDQEPVLAVRAQVSIPAAVVLKGGTDVPRLATFSVGAYGLAVTPEYQADRLPLMTGLKELVAGWDLLEPFERIHAAIAEAQQAA